MYEYIKGKIRGSGVDYIVIETGGIGYRIFTAFTTLELAQKAGEKEEMKIHTLLYVRENIMDLYGFATREELSMFKLLISVSGIGPKAALSLISTVKPSGFGIAVVSDDVKTLTKAQGIGSKTAQKIILELKDKIEKEQLCFENENKKEISFSSADGIYREAVSALMVLGYTAMEAQKAVAVSSKDNDTLEEVIRKSLVAMNR